MTGTIVLGNKTLIFTALPQYYTVTDFDVHVEDSAKSFQNMQSLTAISGELVRGGAADLEDITNIVTATSMTELKRTIDRSIAKKKEENNMLGQMQQQIQEYEQSMKEMQKSMQAMQQENAQLQKQIESNNQLKLELEARRIAIEQERVRNDKEYNDKAIEVKQQQVQAQVAQIYDANPYNDKIKNVL